MEPEPEMTHDEMVLEVEKMLGHETMAGALLRVRLAWQELWGELLDATPWAIPRWVLRGVLRLMGYKDA